MAYIGVLSNFVSQISMKYSPHIYKTVYARIRLHETFPRISWALAICEMPSGELWYRPNVSDAMLAATLLTIHGQCQHVAMPAPSHAPGATAKVEKISRPTVDEGISVDDWLYFEQRWQ